MADEFETNYATSNRAPYDLGSRNQSAIGLIGEYIKTFGINAIKDLAKAILSGLTGGLLGPDSPFFEIFDQFLNMDLSITKWITDFQSLLNALTGIAGADITDIFEWVGKIPLIGDIVKAITGITGGGLPDLTSWAQNIPILGDIVKALTGSWGGLLDLSAWAEGLGGLIGMIPSQLLGLIPLGAITNVEKNMLINGGFDTVKSMDQMSGQWAWNETEGHASPGCAEATANGSRIIEASNLIESVAGDKFNIKGWFKWTGAAGTGSDWARVEAVSTNANGEISAQTIGTVGGTASGGWVEKTGQYTVPTGATHVHVRIVVEANATAGKFYFDDMWASKTGLLKMDWIGGLLERLGGLFDNFQSIIDTILNSIGIGGIGHTISQLLSGLQNIPVGNIFGLDGVLSGLATLFDFNKLLNFIKDGAMGLTGSTGVNLLDIPAILGSLLGKANSAGTLAQNAWNQATSAIDTAAQLITDGLNNVGQYANILQQALRSFIDMIFGTGTSQGSTAVVRWNQEVLVAAGPVTTGLNDIALGFGMPFAATITNLNFYTSDHLSTGAGSKVEVETLRNDTVIHTATWNGGSNSLNISGLNLAVSANDRIRLRVKTATSSMANMSVGIAGRYT